MFKNYWFKNKGITSKGFKNKSILLAVMLAMPMLANAGDVTAGKAKSAMCAGCHGMNGVAVIPGYPNLKGQNALYIESSLKAFKAKTRTGGQSVLMYGMAGALTEADMKNLAAYYSSLK